MDLDEGTVVLLGISSWSGLLLAQLGLEGFPGQKLSMEDRDKRGGSIGRGRACPILYA